MMLAQYIVDKKGACYGMTDHDFFIVLRLFKCATNFYWHTLLAPARYPLSELTTHKTWRQTTKQHKCCTAVWKQLAVSILREKLIGGERLLCHIGKLNSHLISATVQYLETLTLQNSNSFSVFTSFASQLTFSRRARSCPRPSPPREQR